MKLWSRQSGQGYRIKHTLCRLTWRGSLSFPRTPLGKLAMHCEIRIPPMRYRNTELCWFTCGHCPPF